MKKAAPAKKVVAKKAAVKKVVVKKVPAKPAAKKKAPAKAAPAKKVPVKKAAAKKAPVKAVAKKTAKPAAPKAAAKPVKKTAATVKQPASNKAAPKPAAKPASAPKPAKPAAAPVAKAAAPTNRHASQPAAAPPVQGKVATATARHTSPKKQKTPQSSMNNLATTLDNGITREDGRYALPSTSNIDLPKGYRPSNDEEYMNPKHLAYFRNKLREWRDQLVEESRQTMENLRDEVRDVGDEAERATRETENSLELRTRDRYRKLISKIDKALRRIEEGRYGYCEETDEEIGLDRLDARPIATLSLDAQERREHLQKQMGD
ncbi:hypothetical protein ASG87_04320 [Frateuria sp. Soil773]|nr:hypothetical protein ASG87_04320 [Frateuria sp. Soil773]